MLLHLQAVDYDATVWVNGREVGRHRGGFTPFTCNLTGIAEPGKTAVIVVRARDDARNLQPRGKQSDRFENYGCVYTRTTGIWQTVWLEPVPTSALLRTRLTPDLAASLIRVEQGVCGPRRGMKIRAILKDSSNGEVCRAEAPADQDLTTTLAPSALNSTCP